MKRQRTTTTTTILGCRRSWMSPVRPLLLLLLLLMSSNSVYGFSAAPTTVASSKQQKQHVYTRAAVMDYTAANTYMAKYYKYCHHPYHCNTNHSSKSTSTSTSTSTPDCGIVNTVIYNARLGVLDDENNNHNSKDDQDVEKHITVSSPATVTEHGFGLIQSPVGTMAGIMDQPNDWDDSHKLASQFLPVAQKMLQYVYNNDDGDDNNDDNTTTTITNRIVDTLFFTPNYRPTPSSYYIAQVHLDMDLNYWSNRAPEELLDFISEMNPIVDPTTATSSSSSSSSTTASTTSGTWVQAIASGQRFALVNLWCNVHDQPVQKNPLAILRPGYINTNNNDKKNNPQYFPRTRPTNSRWYTFPEMRPDEVLVFCQYDRDARKPSDAWHAALPDDDNNKAVPLRKSFDVRCLVLFDEIVPVEYDRWHASNRIVPVRTPEEYWVG